MKIKKTLEIELDMKARLYGEMFGITEEEGLKIHEKVEEIIKKSKSMRSIYKKIFEEFSDNEALYAFGLVEYLRGREDGKKATLLLISQRKIHGVDEA